MEQGPTFLLSSCFASQYGSHDLIVDQGRLRCRVEKRLARRERQTPLMHKRVRMLRTHRCLRLFENIGLQGILGRSPMEIHRKTFIPDLTKTIQSHEQSRLDDPLTFLESATSKADQWKGHIVCATALKNKCSCARC